MGRKATHNDTYGRYECRDGEACAVWHKRSKNQKSFGAFCFFFDFLSFCFLIVLLCAVFGSQDDT